MCLVSRSVVVFTGNNNNNNNNKFEIEKFYPGPGIEPGPLDLRASVLTITPFRTTTDPR